MKTFLCLLITLLSLHLMAQTITDFPNNQSLKNWKIVNDDVMGGISNSKVYLNSTNHAVFEGVVSLENYGGFCSLRYNFNRIAVAGKKNLKIKLKGDGKNYQLRIKNKRSDYQSYIKSFSTSGEWQLINIPLKEMYPSFRGRRLNMKNFHADFFEQITFLIGNKKPERFSLIIESISLH